MTIQEREQFSIITQREQETDKYDSTQENYQFAITSFGFWANFLCLTKNALITTPVAINKGNKPT